MAQEQIDSGNHHDVAAAENPERGRARGHRAPLVETALNGDLSELDQRVRAVVQERPFLALAGAVVAGYLIGRVLSRLNHTASHEGAIDMSDTKKSDNTGVGRTGGARTSASDRGLQSVREDLNHLGDTARQTVQDWQEVVRDRLTRQPYATLAVAAGFGYVLGGGLPPFVIRTLLVAGGRIAVENMIAQRAAQ